MFLKIWLLPLILASSTIATPSPAPSPSPSPARYSAPDPTKAGYYPSASHKPVYTAQRIREEPESQNDDEPYSYPSTSSLGTAQTTNGAEEPENTGFVEPVDFKNLLREVESNSKVHLGATSSNPLFASESKNSFSGFFGQNNKDPFADFGGGGLATASSERTSKNPDKEDSTGFVDPNVQFRSLFDSSQTASNGFKPEDFLGNQGESSGSDSSRGSQTRAFPSYTYTGRKEDESPRFRSNYRQLETQDDDYNDDYRGRDDRDDGPSYNDRGNSYNNRGNDRGNYGGQPNSYQERGPPPSQRYNQNQAPTPRYSPQESSNRPQSASRSPKSADAKNPKCKKVEKTVDYENNDDYNGFVEPEPDYDPSTYRGRYKRQSRNGRQARQGGKKRPMTCYVCQDEEGRYAERCSYDSNANPNKGEYFHSSSSSFRDDGTGNGNGNGRRNSGKSDRHRRNPSTNRQRSSSSAETSATTISTVSVLPESTDKKIFKDVEESEPKVIEKRQSGPDRYASNYGGNGGPGYGNNNNNGPRDEFDFNPDANGDYDLPRGYIGNNGGRVEDNPYNIQDSPRAGPSSTPRNEFGFGRNDNQRDFGFGGGNNGNNDRSYNDFNFGPPSDFEKEASSSDDGGSGFPREFDFAVPRDYDPDVQLEGPRHSNGPRDRDGPEESGPDGSTSSSNEHNSFPTQFDASYDDYVKRYFPEFSDGASSERPRSSSNSFTPNSGPPNRGSSSRGHNQPSYRLRQPHPSREIDNSFNQHHELEHSPPNHPNHHRGPPAGPDRSHTSPTQNFSPPPNFYGHNPVKNDQNLNKLVENFSGRDRAGCRQIRKGDMTCYVCQDARGMNKEECMYASKDPRNQRMAYHEVTEYSSDPPVKILPSPQHTDVSHNQNQPHKSGSAVAASVISAKTVPSPLSFYANSTHSKSSSPTSKSGSVTRVESVVISSKVHHENKSPVDYDFDY